MYRMILVACIVFCGFFSRASAATDDGLGTITLYQSWRDEGEANGQCGGRIGEFETAFGQRSDAIKFDTDNREGGCVYRVAIVDPHGALAARQWQLNIVFTPQGHIGQCKYPGSRIVPIVRSVGDVAAAWAAPEWLNPIIVDTDDRVGGCVIEFQITGPQTARSPVLDIRYTPDGDPGQCPQAGDKVATLGHPAAIIIDTDNRPGGCFFQMRLRE